MPISSTSILQNWFKTIVVSQGRLPDKLNLAYEKWGLSAIDTIKETENIPIDTRIAVYTTGYMLRLLECMQADLPSLYTFLGEGLFDMFAKAYLLEQPSSSFSLYQLTAGFADFLDRTHPPVNPNFLELALQYDLPGELVRMERARLAVILSKGTEGEIKFPQVDFFTFFMKPEIRLCSHPCLQLLIQKMPLIAFYQKLMAGDVSSELPDYKITYLAASRINFKIQFYELNKWQYLFLENLKSKSNGTYLYETIEELSQTTEIEKGELLSQIGLWLPSAIAMGLLIEG